MPAILGGSSRPEGLGQMHNSALPRAGNGHQKLNGGGKTLGAEGSLRPPDSAPRA